MQTKIFIVSVGLMSETTTLHVHQAFLYISLPFLHDYDVKMPNFAFYFFFLNLDMVPTHSTPEGFAYKYIWQSKWVGLITMKTERAQIHFLRTFSLPSGRWILMSLITTYLNQYEASLI